MRRKAYIEALQNITDGRFTYKQVDEIAKLREVDINGILGKEVTPEQKKRVDL